MHQEADRLRQFSRRAWIVGSAQIGLVGLLAGRLYQLQIRDSSAFSLLAEDNRVNQRAVAPARGRIFDRSGRPLARNVPTYRVRIVREQTSDLRTTLEALARLASIDADMIDRIVEQAARQRAFVAITIREGLSWQEVSRISLHAPELPGISLDSTLLRDYPENTVLAHVLGYLGPVDKKELLEDPDPVLKIPDFRVGKNGIEKTYNTQLRGRAGWSRMEVNAHGREIRELDRDDGDPGRNVTLSLDIDLQKFCYERLSNELAASAVVVDVNSGAVLASASVPSFDPRAFSGRLSHRQWRELSDNPRTPLVNKCIAGQYPPGSTFKMVTALAALEAGVSPDYETFCPGFMSLGRARFHCWKQAGHGKLALIQGLAQSCDVYFYNIARLVGVDAIADMARKFGLGDQLGVDLPGEKPGLIPTRDWKLQTIGEKWQRGETLVIGIGQGFVLATPLQLAIMVARLCNGGRAVQPWYAHGSAASQLPYGDLPTIGISKSSISAVLRGMFEVVNGPRGTARRAALGIPGMTLAGKTGTSQVRRISRSDRAQGLHKRKDRPWNERDHALFVAFAPVEQPQYAVSVIVEHGQSGSKAAAPIARDIMTKALELNPSSYQFVTQA